MFKNRFILIVGLLSVLLVTMAVSNPIPNAPTAEELSWPPRPVIRPAVDNTLLSDYYQRQAALNASAEAGEAVNLANDFYQRHTDWVSSAQNIGIPVTGMSESLDYFQRHPELSVSAETTLDLASDFYQRHPELSISVEKSADMTDYFVRHPELRAPMQTIDLSDYFLRH